MSAQYKLEHVYSKSWRRFALLTEPQVKWWFFTEDDVWINWRSAEGLEEHATVSLGPLTGVVRLGGRHRECHTLLDQTPLGHCPSISPKNLWLLLGITTTLGTCDQRMGLVLERFGTKTLGL